MSLLENPDWERGEAFFPTARRNDGEGRDLRLRSNAAVEKKGRRPEGTPSTTPGGAASHATKPASSGESYLALFLRIG